MSGTKDPVGGARPLGDRRLRLVLAALVIAYLVVSLFPFLPDPPRLVDNGAMRVGDAVAFPAPGMATVPEASVDLLPLGPDDVPVTIELVVESAGGQPGSGLARILALSSGPFGQSLVVGQAGGSLAVRLRRPGATETGTPALRASRLFARPGPHRVVVEVGSAEATLAVDGQPVDRAVASGVDLWSRHHRLLLGNEHGGRRPWLGRIDTATVTTPAGGVDLLARAELPESYWRVPDRLLTDPPWYAQWGLGTFELLHGLALALLGWFAMQVRPRPRARTVLLACWMLSAVTLVAKVFIEARHPAAGDFVIEAFGATVGVVLARRQERQRQSQAAQA